MLPPRGRLAKSVVSARRIIVSRVSAVPRDGSRKFFRLLKVYLRLFIVSQQTENRAPGISRVRRLLLYSRLATMQGRYAPPIRRNSARDLYVR